MKLDHIVLYLSDLDRCMPFYDRLLPLLGFEKTRDHVFANAEAIDLSFEPGSTAAYHAMNYGWVLGELVRRVTGRSVGTHLRERVAERRARAGDLALGMRGAIDNQVAFTWIRKISFSRTRSAIVLSLYPMYFPTKKWSGIGICRAMTSMKSDGIESTIACSSLFSSVSCACTVDSSKM